ncbi:MAG TPA: hypothetical protein VGC79_06370, partial [Polyangiaceae bacterium]
GSNCTHGGTKLQSGLDTNSNNALDAGEITQTSYACNGASASGGPTVVDGNGVTLGTATYIDSYAVTIKTSAGYYYSVSWAVAFFDSQVRQPSSVPITTASIWNGDSGCSTYIDHNTGWVLTPITRSDAGIPTSIAGPLTVN